MFKKHYLLTILFLISILSSCSCMTEKPDETLTSKINFSEQIIFATLDNKAKSGAFMENEKSIIAPSCVFDRASYDSTDISFKKFKVKLLEGVNKFPPLTEDQMKEAFELLKTGHVESDLKNTIVTMLTRIQGIPNQILSDATNIFRNPWDISKMPGLHSAGEIAKTYIKPDNKTFRLAILVYARMNGVNIDEKNMDDLHDFLNKGNTANFDTLVKGGLKTMNKQYGLNDFMEAAQKFHSISQACMGKAS